MAEISRGDKTMTSHGMTDKALIERSYRGFGPENKSIVDQLCVIDMLH